MSFEGEKKPDVLETIKAAATIYKEKMYTGTVHPAINADILKEFPEARPEDFKEGFVTTSGRFLTREEAKSMAHKQKLLRPGRDKWMDKELWSEYLPHDVLHLPNPEWIESAAIRYKGETFIGRAHYNAWLLMTAKYPEMVNSQEGREDGFMTNTGRFVNREEALKIAEKADELSVERGHEGSRLYSEDLKKNEE